MNDGDCIKAALEELGYVYEEHKEASHLNGYMGDQREQVANIIVRRRNVGNASNDIGFLKKPNGNYEMIISEFDKGGNKKQAVDFMKKLKQIYGKHKAIKQCAKMGFKKIKVQKTTEDGKIKIRIRA
jgi:hypothetical protein